MYCVYIYIYYTLCVYVCMYVCMHACMHVCMHVCMYVYIYIRTRTHDMISHHFSINCPSPCVKGFVVISYGSYPHFLGPLGPPKVPSGACPRERPLE